MKMRLKILIQSIFICIFVMHEFSLVSTLNLNRTGNSTQRSNEDKEGRLMGLVDYILTPTRWTRNLVRWIMNGLVFAGAFTQGDTFLHAFYEGKDRKNAEEEKEKKANRRNEVLGMLQNLNQEMEMEDYESQYQPQRFDNNLITKRKKRDAEETNNKSKGNELLFNLLPKIKEELNTGRFMGFVDYILTPTRWTRNLVRWIMDGLIFAGAWTQGDTFIRAVYESMDRKQAAEEEAQKMKASRKAYEMSVNSNYPPINNEQMTGYNQIYGYQSGDRGLYQNYPDSLENNFYSRSGDSGDVNLETKILHLNSDMCIKKALCLLMNLAKKSSDVLEKLIDLSKSPTFIYKQDLTEISTVPNCDETFQLCKLSNDEIKKRIL